ncbi:hypothetical protein FGO68_gene9001 [Halteria grandinella]|uniref:Uncharacterized protein n=1 Tax=Halteria grandinella TaxID=5974 RepID=A0A8J8NDW6_HALGN|nr:hypothetical protein FGO68_gene9001 [Halteria grandinella]
MVYSMEGQCFSNFKMDKDQFLKNLRKKSHLRLPFFTKNQVQKNSLLRKIQNKISVESSEKQKSTIDQILDSQSTRKKLG